MNGAIGHFYGEAHDYDYYPQGWTASDGQYNEGIEIEVDTVEEERRKGLATAASAALILRCLDEGLYYYSKCRQLYNYYRSQGKEIV